MATHAPERSDAWWYHRVLGHAHATTRLRAGRQARTAFGWMIERPADPGLWTVNRAQVAPGAAGLEAAEVLALVEAEHAARGLRHRAVDVRDARDADRLAPVLRAAGWGVLDLRVLTVVPPALAAALAGGTPANVRVHDAPPENAFAVRRASAALELGWAGPDERDAAAAQWVRAPAREALHLLARDARGEAVGACVLHLGDRHVEVDDLVVDPDRRGAGIGSALLAGAARVARDRDAARIGLLTAAGERPAGWYVRLGFVELGPAPSAFRGPLVAG